VCVFLSLSLCVSAWWGQEAQQLTAVHGGGGGRWFALWRVGSGDSHVTDTTLELLPTTTAPLSARAAYTDPDADAAASVIAAVPDNHAPPQATPQAIEEVLERSESKGDLIQAPASAAAVRAGLAAFPGLARELAAIEAASSLPVTDDLAVVLLYLCLLRGPLGRAPTTVAEDEAFSLYIHKRYRTYTWLAPLRGSLSFFAPALLPIAAALVTLYDASLSVHSAVVMSCLFGVAGVVFGQVSGWIITGTQPNASSEAANHCQNTLLDLSEDYTKYAIYLLDLYTSADLPRTRDFAAAVAAALNVDAVENSMFLHVPRPDPREPEDPILSRARFRRLLGPLREVVAYIRSEGCTLPRDESLRVRLEVVQLREQVLTLSHTVSLLARMRVPATQHGGLSDSDHAPSSHG
jgi:hypothetical protein